MNDRQRKALGLWLLAVAVYLAVQNGLFAGIGLAPAPIPEAGFRVLIVEETDARGSLPKPQLEIFTANGPGSVREYLKAKAKEFRVLDKDQAMDRDTPLWQAAMKRERKSLPWLIASNGRTGYEGPLPADTAATLAILRPIGGQ